MLQTSLNTPDHSTNNAPDAAQVESIRNLNDEFRAQKTSLSTALGQWVKSQGIHHLPWGTQWEILERIKQYNAFDEANDPWGEHDFGSFKHKDHKVFWKIDYYDIGLKRASTNPADPKVTCRVLTVMLAEEY